MKPTKEQILACDDEKQLNEWIAEICIGWERVKLHTNFYKYAPEDYWRPISPDKPNGLLCKDWQPCSNTEKGKAQCWGLAEKYELELDFVLKCARYDDKQTELTYEVHAGCMQIAVAKAALISELEK